MKISVHAKNDTVQAVGKIAGTNGTELISEQKVESRVINNECNNYPDIQSYRNELYYFKDYFYAWRIAPFQTKAQVLSHKSAKLSYKNLHRKCVDISFEDTLYDILYKSLDK